MTSQHPDAAQLLRHVLAGTGESPDAGAARHAGGCVECRATLSHLRATVDALRLLAPQSDRATADCLDEESIAAFAAGDADPAESAAQLPHLLTCPRCCREVASVARLLDDASVANELRLLTPVRPAAHGRRRGAVRAIAGTAAAAAAVLLLFLRMGPEEHPGAPTYREQSVTGVVPPTPLAPVGAVAAAESLRWTSVPRANRYRVAVFERDGSVVWQTETSDTAVALPPRLASPSGAAHLWTVEARVGWEDRWATSELTEFTVRRSPPR